MSNILENETDLHSKVVELIRNHYPDSLLLERQGEYKKGYQPDLMILNFHKGYNGLCIDFKLPNNNYYMKELQLKMKEKYCENNYAFIISNDYDKISNLIHKYMTGLCIPCKYCERIFSNKKTLQNHYKINHLILKNF